MVNIAIHQSSTYCKAQKQSLNHFSCQDLKRIAFLFHQKKHILGPLSFFYGSIRPSLPWLFLVDGWGQGKVGAQPSKSQTMGVRSSYSSMQGWSPPNKWCYSLINPSEYQVSVLGKQYQSNFFSHQPSTVHPYQMWVDYGKLPTGG